MAVPSVAGDVLSPYDPYPKQEIFHSCPAQHKLFGGAVGGGKSDALIAELHETCMEVEAAGYADQVIMLRRTFPELQENIDRARQLIGDLAVWRTSEKRFLYPNGSTLEFGHVQHDEDVLAYKSRQFLVVAFDEETSFSVFIRLYMQTRNRSKTPFIQPKMIGATNPGDVGHLGVAQYYIDVDPAEVGERLFYWPIAESELCWGRALEEVPLQLGEPKGPTLEHYRKLVAEAGLGWRAYPPGTDGKPLPFDIWRPRQSAGMQEVNVRRAAKGQPAIVPPTRCFIPSFLHDNPSLSLDGAYEAQLLSSPDQKMVLTLYYGDWSSWDGQAFPEFRRTRLRDTPEGMVEVEWHVVGPILPPPHWRMWRAIDWGYGAPLCCLWFAEDPATGELLVYRELYRAGLRDREVVDMVLAMTPADERVHGTYVDPKSFWAGNSNDDGRKLHEIYKDYGLEVQKAQNARIDGKRRIHDLLAENLEQHAPGLRITEDCANLIRTLESLVGHPEHPEDIDERGEDHSYDCLRYGVMAKPGRVNTRRGLRVLRSDVSGEDALYPGSLKVPGSRDGSRLIIVRKQHG